MRFIIGTLLWVLFVNLFYFALGYEMITQNAPTSVICSSGFQLPNTSQKVKLKEDILTGEVDGTDIVYVIPPGVACVIKEE